MVLEPKTPESLVLQHNHYTIEIETILELFKRYTVKYAICHLFVTYLGNHGQSVTLIWYKITWDVLNCDYD